MKLLREYIKKVLLEGAKGVDDLPSNTHIKIWKLSHDVNIQFTDATGDQFADDIIHGLIVIRHVDKALGNCGGAMVVGWASTKSGWGPLLYDIAIEYATLNANGLTADREAVSSDALRVWDYYLNNRSDVKATQLDNEQGELTPDDKSDDCMQVNISTLDKKSKDNWINSSISKRYTKSPTTINALQKANKLIEGPNQ